VENKTTTQDRQLRSWNTPEMFTAKELEALLKIRREDHIYVRSTGTDSLRSNPVKRPLSQTKIFAWIEERNFLPRPIKKPA